MYSALDILNLSPVIPVISIDRKQNAVALGRALLAGGIRVMEITLRTGAAWHAIDSVRASLGDMVVGVGTVTNTTDVRRASDAGAHFLVSPGCTPELIEATYGADMPFLPGVMTPSEVMTARNAGFRALKLFPAQPAGGINMLKALSGPFPDLMFCPTGGIDAAAMPAFLALKNVACVGGSWLTPKEAMDNEDWHTIENLARRAVAAASKHREKS